MLYFWAFILALDVALAVIEFGKGAYWWGATYVVCGLLAMREVRKREFKRKPEETGGSG